MTEQWERDLMGPPPCSLATLIFLFAITVLAALVLFLAR